MPYPDPATTDVRLRPGDRGLLDRRLSDLDENLSVGNRRLAAHALDQLAAEALRAAETLRDTPATPGVAAVPRTSVAAARRHQSRQAALGRAVAYYALIFSGGLVSLAGLGVVWWLAGGRLADVSSLMDKGTPLAAWHWQPVAAAGAAMLTAAIGEGLDAAGRRFLRRRRNTTVHTDQA